MIIIRRITMHYYHHSIIIKASVDRSWILQCKVKHQPTSVVTYCKGNKGIPSALLTFGLDCPKCLVPLVPCKPLPLTKSSCSSCSGLLGLRPPLTPLSLCPAVPQEVHVAVRYQQQPDVFIR